MLGDVGAEGLHGGGHVAAAAPLALQHQRLAPPRRHVAGPDLWAPPAGARRSAERGALPPRPPANQRAGRTARGAPLSSVRAGTARAKWFRPSGAGSGEEQGMKGDL